MKQYLLSETGTFFKVNMHCHTVLSDGKQTPEEIKRLFREHGYSAVAFTDHELMPDHSDLTDETFVALTAYEYGFNKSPENPLTSLYKEELKTRDHAENVHLNLYSKDPHGVLRSIIFWETSRSIAIKPSMWIAPTIGASVRSKASSFAREELPCVDDG